MRRGTALIFVFTLVLLLIPSPLWAKTVSLGELVSTPNKYDGQIVEVRGEIIGEPLKEKDGYWVNISDGQGVVGVFIHSSLGKQDFVGGDYNYRGDEILVKGPFHISCPKHGGDLDIHAEKIQLIKRGEKVYHPFDSTKLFFALILLFLVGVSLYLKS